MFTKPWWIVYNDFYPVATEVTSNLLSLAWRLRLHPIVGSNDPKPDPIYASLRLAFHPKCALQLCIAQYRLKFQIIHCQFFFWIRPWLSKNRRKLWRTHLKDNGWNSVMASGFGCIKIVGYMRNHFGGDILSSLFSTRWKLGKLLETIIKGEIA